jgi:hypothetical protein
MSQVYRLVCLGAGCRVVDPTGRGRYRRQLECRGWKLEHREQLVGGGGTLNLGDGWIVGGTINSVSPVIVGDGTLDGVTIGPGTSVNIGGDLSLQGSWNNQGTISGNNEVILGGNFTTANMGTINCSTVEIAGTWNNTGSTVPAGSAAWWLDNATIIGGTLNMDLTAVSAGSTLQGVQLAGQNLNLGDYTITIQNGISGVGQNLNMNGGNNQNLDFTGPSQTISNVNIVPLASLIGTTPPEGGAYPFAQFTIEGQGSSPSTLTIASTASITTNTWAFYTVDGSGSNNLINNGTITVNAGRMDFSDLNSVINNGTIKLDNPASVSSDLGVDPTVSSFTNNVSISVSSGSALFLQAGNWTNSAGATIAVDGATLSLYSQNGTGVNEGTITATNGSTVNLYGETTANLGLLRVSSDSSVNVIGTLDNTGATLSPAMYGGTWSLVGGTIENGIVDLSGTTLNLASATFSNVTLTGGDLTDTTTTLIILNGFNATGHNLNLIAGADLMLNGPSQTIDNVTINGTGRAMLNGTRPAGITVGGPSSPGPVTDTLGANVTVQGNVQISQFLSGSTLVNNGVINGDVFVGVSTSYCLNNGIIEATNGGTVDVSQTSLTNNGTIAVHTGTIIVASPLNVGRGTLAGSGTIQGNVVLSNDPSTLAFQIGGTAQGSQYDYMQVLGSMTLGGNLQVSLTNGFESLITSDEQFIVLSADSPLEGSFLNVADGGDLYINGGVGFFLVNYGSGQYANDVVLSDFEQVVPEPSSLALLAIASAMCFKRRHR